MVRVMHTLLSITLVAVSAAALAAPVGYSVNSDAPDGDALHRVDLETGEATQVSDLQVLSATTGVRKDIEGLAFDRDGLLWAVDEDSFRLFQISTTSGIVRAEGDVPISGLSERSGNDFGMTFTCGDDLYISSVTSQTLYRLELDGRASVVGAEGALGYNISALASWGNPARLYGLGNGLTGDGEYQTDSRSLFSIDLETGTATVIGELGDAAGDYFQAGLSFSDDGSLWALIDRGPENSQVLRIDAGSGTATLVSSMNQAGFESLAVSPPGGCIPPNDPNAEPRLVSVPTLDGHGRLLTLVLLLGTGLLAAGRRIS